MSSNFMDRRYQAHPTSPEESYELAPWRPAKDRKAGLLAIATLLVLFAACSLRDIHL